MDGYRNLRVLVLGASGFIGRWVARSLYAVGANVFLNVRDQIASHKVFDQYGVFGEIIVSDLRDPVSVREVIHAVKPSIIFNLAGYGIDPTERDQDTAYLVNAELVNTIGEELANVRDPDWRRQDIIHVGSALEYGKIRGDLQEDSLANPTTLYGKTKLVGTKNLEKCCDLFGIKGLTARLFTVYGPGERPGRLLPSILKLEKNDGVLQLTSGEQKRDFTYVEDVADGLLRLGLTTGKNGRIVNLATGKLTSVREFVETAADVLRIPGEKLNFGALPTRPEEMHHDPVTIQRLKQFTGWVPPTNISTGVDKTKAFIDQLYGGC
jgi:nucleoside-diphosphate-sugar epimerase